MSTYVCFDLDRECGDMERSWCATCPKRKLQRRAAPLPAAPAPTPAAAEGQAEQTRTDDAFALSMLSALARRGASSAGLSLAAQLFGVGACADCRFRKLYCRCAAPLPRQAAVQTNTNKLLTIIASAYQIAGWHDAPEHILDVLSDPEAATMEQVEAMLPYQPGLVQTVPDVLFDGYAVYEEITRMVGKGHCISPEAVAATLDAAVRMIRAAATVPGEPGQ